MLREQIRTRERRKTTERRKNGEKAEYREAEKDNGTKRK